MKPYEFKPVERLAGPSATLGWTPDHIPAKKRELVVVVRDRELKALEAQVQNQADIIQRFLRAVDGRLAEFS